VFIAAEDYTVVVVGVRGAWRGWSEVILPVGLSWREGTIPSLRVSSTKTESQHSARKKKQSLDLRKNLLSACILPVYKNKHIFMVSSCEM